MGRHHERAVRAEHLLKRVDNGGRPATDPPERGQRRVHEQRLAALDTETPQVTR
ncbi:MAG: hypothetical protein J07HX64_01447 [halophilic archaeon J07HX64]|nr:MAG: hypothetical protein J07HX64_01447 [halophilic archaeon J07HX64]